MKLANVGESLYELSHQALLGLEQLVITPAKPRLSFCRSAECYGAVVLWLRRNFELPKIMGIKGHERTSRGCRGMLHTSSHPRGCCSSTRFSARMAATSSVNSLFWASTCCSHCCCSRCFWHAPSYLRLTSTLLPLLLARAPPLTRTVQSQHQQRVGCRRHL